MSGHNHHEESSFWPAYVDAITNVMLNILFVVAVFAMALNTVVKDAPKEKTVEDAKDMKNAEGDLNTDVQSIKSLISQQKEPQESPPKSLYVRESANQGSNKSAGLRWTITPQEAGGELLVRFDFAAGNSQIDKSDANAVLDSLRKVAPLGTASQWLIWVSLNTRNSADARQAYQRVMSVRGALIDAGQVPQNIEVRLLDDGQEPQNAGRQSVWLSRSLQSSPPAPS